MQVNVESVAEPVSDPVSETGELVVHCAVTNSRAQTSDRYVQQSVFGLWHHLVTARHGLRIGAHRVSVWLPQSQLDNHPHFTRRDDHQAVTRLTMTRYCPATGLTTRAQRFIAERDMDKVARYLTQHWRAAGKQSDELHYEQDPGWAIA